MKRFKTNRMFFSAGAILIGLILLIWPASSLMIIGKCLGVLLAAGGVASGIFYLKDHESAAQTALLVLGVIMIICGVVIFLHPEELVKLIPTIMGILVLLSGIINLGETFTLSRQKYTKWWISLIISIITIGAGLFLIIKAFDLVAVITRIAGGILVFDGISDLWVVSRLSADTSKEPVDSVIVSEETARTEPKPEAAASVTPAPAEEKPEAPAPSEVKSEAEAPAPAEVKAEAEVPAPAEVKAETEAEPLGEKPNTDEDTASDH